MGDAQSIVKALWMLPQAWNMEAEGPNSDEDLVLQPGDSPRELLSFRMNQNHPHPGYKRIYLQHCTAQDFQCSPTLALGSIQILQREEPEETSNASNRLVSKIS